MRRSGTVLLIVIVALTMMLTAGCGRDSEASMEAVRTAYEGTGSPSGELVSMDHKGSLSAPKDGEDPDTHQMMAMFILNGAGQNSDLSTYDSVELIEVSVGGGASFMAVVINGEDVVFPDALGGAQ